MNKDYKKNLDELCPTAIIGINGDFEAPRIPDINPELYRDGTENVAADSIEDLVGLTDEELREKA